jgi:small subunit ribosomal protein S21
VGFYSLTLPAKNPHSVFPKTICGNCQRSFARPRKEVSTLTEIKLKKGEPVDRALRRLKKKVDREGTLKVVRGRRQFEKPSERRRRKEKVARFSAMLAARHADD